MWVMFLIKIHAVETEPSYGGLSSKKKMVRAPLYLSHIRKSSHHWATSGYQFEPHRHRARGLSSNRARAQPASHARPRSYMACPHAIVQVLFTVGSFDVGTGGWLTCHRSSLPLNPPSKSWLLVTMNGEVRQPHTNKMLLMDAANWTHSGPGRYRWQRTRACWALRWRRSASWCSAARWPRISISRGCGASWFDLPQDRHEEDWEVVLSCRWRAEGVGVLVLKDADDGGVVERA